MKPRLDSAALTAEDYDIFLERWSEAYVPDNGVFFRKCQEADRRDAALMLFAQQLPDSDVIRLGYFDADVRVRMSPWVRWVDP